MRNKKRNEEMSKIIVQTRAHRIGVQEYLFIKNAPNGQPTMTESRAMTPVINVAVDVSIWC